MWVPQPGLAWPRVPHQPGLTHPAPRHRGPGEAHFPEEVPGPWQGLPSGSGGGGFGGRGEPQAGVSLQLLPLRAGLWLPSFM